MCVFMHECSSDCVVHRSWLVPACFPCKNESKELYTASLALPQVILITNLRHS